MDSFFWTNGVHLESFTATIRLFFTKLTSFTHFQHGDVLWQLTHFQHSLFTSILSRRPKLDKKRFRFTNSWWVMLRCFKTRKSNIHSRGQGGKALEKRRTKFLFIFYFFPDFLIFLIFSSNFLIFSFWFFSFFQQNFFYNHFVQI